VLISLQFRYQLSKVDTGSIAVPMQLLQAFLFKKRLRWPGTQDCELGTSIWESVHHDAPYLHVPLPVLGCTGRFVHSRTL